MRNGKLYACAALVLLLMLLRFCFPEQVGQAQARAARAVNPNGCCSVFARSLGQTLDGAGLKDSLIAVFHLGEEVFR